MIRAGDCERKTCRLLHILGPNSGNIAITPTWQLFTAIQQALCTEVCSPKKRFPAICSFNCGVKLKAYSKGSLVLVRLVWTEKISRT